MNLTARDRILVMFMPAIFIVIGYGFWVNMTKQAEITALQRNLDGAIRSTPTLQTINEKQIRLLQLKPEVKRLEESTKAEQARWETLVCQCADAARRNERREKLTTLFAHKGVQLIEDGAGEGGASAKDVKQPASLEALAKQLTVKSPSRHPQLWRLHLYGRYPELCRALDELAHGEVLAIPVGLCMKDAQKGKKGREWALPNNYIAAQLVASNGPPLTKLLWCVDHSWGEPREWVLLVWI